MSYSKQNFEAGNLLYASQLNAMDNQIAANEAALNQKASVSGLNKLANNVADNAAAIATAPAISEPSGPADLDIADENGHVLARFENGHIQTKKFNSADIQNDIEHYMSEVKTFVSGGTNTISVIHSFKKGQRILFHVEDGSTQFEYGHYANYFQGQTQIASSRRGSNGYFEHVISEDCTDVSITVGSNEYTDGTEIKLHVYVMNGEPKQKVITVGTGKMFSTLKAAVESITDANSYINPYVIEVYPGTYDTLSGYTSEQIESANVSGVNFTQSTFVGVKLTDGMSIRGVGGTRDAIILTAELNTGDYNATIRGNISTLNIQGRGFIENMTIIGKNIRYCVHDDFVEPTNTLGWRRLKDLAFKGDNLAYPPYCTTYGAGMTMPRDYIIENCDFGFDLGIHSSGNYKRGCRIEVKNCKGHRFRIGDYASAEGEAKNHVLVNDCSFEAILINRQNTSLSSHMLVSGTGGVNAMVKCQSDEIYALGMIDKAPAGLSVGTLVGRTSTNFALEATTDIEIAYGVVVAVDSDFSYVQREGYVPSNLIGLSGLSQGDYVTVDSSGAIISGDTAENSIGVVKAMDGTVAFILLTL